MFISSPFDKKLLLEMKKNPYPYCYILQQALWGPLPSLIFSVLCIISVLLNTMLPETLGKPMPESVQEAINLAR